jgi:hypothetical protein
METRLGLRTPDAALHTVYICLEADIINFKLFIKATDPAGVKHVHLERDVPRVADPDPAGSGFNRVSGSGSGSRRAKMTHKIRKKI